MDLAVTRSALERPIVLVPIACALLAAAGAMLWRGALPRESAVSAPVQKTAFVTHVAANADIARGQIVLARDLRIVSGATAPASSLAQTQDIEGHVALVAIPSGATILTQQISAAPIPGIAARVPEGYRAYSLAVSEAEIAGGFLQAGDHVDVAVTFPGALFGDTSTRPGDKSRSTMLLQSVAVLAVGIKLNGDGNPDPQTRTVTLALKAQDIAKVALAARLGAISFAIRNPVDDASQPQSQAALGMLVGDAPVPAARKASASRGIPMLSGATRTTVTVP